jgi:hypothetical protein
LKPDARLFAVIDHVDPTCDLLPDDVPDRSLAFPLKLHPVDRFAAFLANQQVAERLGFGEGFRRESSESGPRCASSRALLSAGRFASSHA